MSQDPIRSTDSTARSNITAKAVSEPTGSNTSEDLKFRTAFAETGMSEDRVAEGSAVDGHIIEKEPTATSGASNNPAVSAPSHRKDLSSLLVGRSDQDRSMPNPKEELRKKRKALWENAKSQKFELLPDGAYVVSLTERRDMTTSTNKWACQLHGRVCEGPLAGEKMPPITETIDGRENQAKAALEIADTPFDRVGDPFERDVRVRVLVTHYTDKNGRTWNRVDLIGQVSVMPFSPDPFAPGNGAGGAS